MSDSVLLAKGICFGLESLLMGICIYLLPVYVVEGVIRGLMHQYVSVCASHLLLVFICRAEAFCLYI